MAKNDFLDSNDYFWLCVIFLLGLIIFFGFIIIAKDIESKANVKIVCENATSKTYINYHGVESGNPMAIEFCGNLNEFQGLLTGMGVIQKNAI